MQREQFWRSSFITAVMSGLGKWTGKVRREERCVSRVIGAAAVRKLLSSSFVGSSLPKGRGRVPIGKPPFP